MVKIALVTDYFYPFTPGGAEWSVYDLAKSLKVRGVESSVITINYGAKSNESFNGLNIVRIPFLKKLNKNRSVVNPIWQNNPFFFLTSAIHLVRAINKEKPDVLHVHGKFLIPAAIISGLVTRKPVIITIRDKQMLCSIGKCFFDADRKKACGFIEYLTKEIPWFYKNYVKNRSLVSMPYIYIGSIWSRFSFIFIKFLTQKAQAVVAISQSQRSYLEKNGFKNVKVIYNTESFYPHESKVQKEKTILFAGKLSKGKGADILLDAIKQLKEKINIKFLVAGSINVSKTKNFNKNVKFLGSLGHKALCKYYLRVSGVVMPSVYPEAFGRVALEALAAGTPAVVVNIGALPEIVNDGQTGRVVAPTASDLEKGMLDIIKNEKRYKENIKREYPNLKNKFYTEPIMQHISLYKNLI